MKKHKPLQLMLEKRREEGILEILTKKTLKNLVRGIQVEDLLTFKIRRRRKC